MVRFERGDEPKASEGTPQTGMLAGRFNPYGVAIKGEVHFVARYDPEAVTKLFRDYDLAFWANPVSHTSQYYQP
jgi:hypothetical protein